MLRFRTVAFAMCLCLAAVLGSAEDTRTGHGQIEDWIAKLASPNKEPTRLGPTAVYPEGYDRMAQRTVMDAWHKLCDAAPNSFPHVLKHLDDARYSFTADGGSADSNWSVGRASRDVLSCCLQPYGSHFVESDVDPRSLPRRPDYLEQHRLSEALTAQKWWNARKDKSLRELQIEVLEWVISQEVKRPKDYTEQERNYLNGVMTTLRKSDAPLPPSVPWYR